MKQLEWAINMPLRKAELTLYWFLWGRQMPIKLLDEVIEYKLKNWISFDPNSIHYKEGTGV